MNRFENDNIKYDSRLDNSKELSFIKLNGKKRRFQILFFLIKTIYM